MNVTRFCYVCYVVLRFLGGEFLYSFQSQPFQIMVCSIVEFWKSSFIFGVAFGYHDNHALASSSKEHPIGILLIEFALGLTDIIPTTANKRIVLPSIPRMSEITIPNEA